MTTTSKQYQLLVEKFLSDPNVSQAKKNGFGSGMRVNGKVFAMPVKNKLVIKLPEKRISELVAAGEGEPYIYGGRIAKGWLVVSGTSEKQWEALTKEALAFVSAES